MGRSSPTQLGMRAAALAPPPNELVPGAQGTLAAALCWNMASLAANDSASGALLRLPAAAAPPAEPPGLQQLVTLSRARRRAPGERRPWRALAMAAAAASGLLMPPADEARGVLPPLEQRRLTPKKSPAAEVRGVVSTLALLKLQLLQLLLLLMSSLLPLLDVLRMLPQLPLPLPLLRRRRLPTPLRRLELLDRRSCSGVAAAAVSRASKPDAPRVM
jgi:hypothetical protein